MIKRRKKAPQDKIRHQTPRKKVTHYPTERLQQEQIDASYYFSDEFQPNLANRRPDALFKRGANAYEPKKIASW